MIVKHILPEEWPVQQVNDRLTMTDALEFDVEEAMAAENEREELPQRVEELLNVETKESPSLPSTMVSSASPKPRLMIQSLVLENFKSYGGSVRIGPFHKRFSSIVGPNGSGKSNVIDAMQFVFGRRAKQLRHSKMSELLHHSNTYPNVSSGSVTVYFQEIIDTGDGDDDFDVLPGSEFAVSRKAFKNNTSKYYLKGKETKMKHVIELLKSKGVDLNNNRFLILQGEVEQIAMMKPKSVNAHEDGLLEYLEDIIGTNRYVEEIETLAGQVETLNEERTHKLNRVKAVQKERDGLEGAKVEAETYLEKEHDYYTKKMRFIGSQIAEHDDELRAQLEVRQAAQEKLDESESLFKEREKNVNELEKRFNTKKKQTDTFLEKLNCAENEYAAFERQDIQIRENLKALKAKVKKLTATVGREEKKKLATSEELEAHKLKMAEADEDCKTLESILRGAESELEKVHGETREITAPIREQLEGKQKELLPYTDTVNKCAKDLEVSRTERKLLIEKRDAPAKRLADEEKTLESLRGDLLSAKAAVSSHEEHLIVSKTRISQISNIERTLTENAKLYSAHVSDLHRKVADARQASQDSSVRSRVQSGLHAAMSDGRITGVVGRLGDLASVDARYDVAVGAAAGGRLDNIVVKTADAAQACIHLLRRENLGRATFVILEKIQYLNRRIDGWCTSNKNTDGPRLFDYLNIPRMEHRVALYHALGDTLVAESLDEARRMAFKPTRKNKVVTTSGELIESSGAMSGGGGGPPRHRLGKGANAFDVNPQALKNATKDLDDAQHKLKQCEAELNELNVEQSALQLNMEQSESSARKAKMDVQSLCSLVANCEKNSLPELRKAVADAKTSSADGKRFRQLEKDINEGESKLESAKNACEGLQNAILELQNTIVAAGGSRLQKAKEKVDKTLLQLGTEKSNASKSKSRAKEAEKAVQKAETSLQKLKADIETAEKMRQEKKVESDSLVDKAAALMKSHDDAKRQHQEALKLQEEMYKDYSSVKDALKIQRREEVSLKEKLSEADRAVRNCKLNVKECRKDLRKVQSNLKRIDDLIYGTLGAENDNAQDAEDKMIVDSNGNGGEGDGDIDTQVEDDKSECGDVADANGGTAEGEKILSASEKSKLVKEIALLQGEIANKSPDLRAIAEYKKKESECEEHVRELDEMTEKRDAERKKHDKLCKQRHDDFKTGFDEICKKLKELYQMITLGGDAELEFVDSMDPFGEGVVFSVRPPKKSWKNISNLSGGEKTLSSLALVFALHYYKPTPLYFLDEIDAALDFKNVSIVANYVKERTKDAQFIIISLRNNMFELADRLVGIYKTHHSTKSVTVNPKAFVVAPGHA